MTALAATGLGWVLASTPLPTPTTPEELDPTTVSPGLIGFLVTFAIAVATVLLLLDMVRRVRRLKYREQQAAAVEEREAERVAAEGADDVGREDDPR